MAKLTLSVDGRVVGRAKRYAARRGTSISQLVEHYLDLVSRSSEGPNPSLPPVTRRLRGVLKDARYDRKRYLDHLERKYR